jgi:hypothetical protein
VKLALSLVAATVITALSCPSAQADTKRFALVIGNNGSQEGQPALRYADDDAVRWAIVLGTFGADVELLTDLDADSRTLYGAEAPAHRSPARREIDAAMSRLADRMKQARAQGARTAFFFVFAGHGDVQNGEGYLSVADGRFFRHELEQRILASSPADTNHVVIDACRSFFFAFDRGPGGERRAWRQPYFDAGVSGRFRNTGFILASSSGGAAHEWEEFQAGIFSHEVRSGLLGAADADGDGRITYPELAAFVRVANQSVRNERFRPRVLARPPEQGDPVLIELRAASGGVMRLGDSPTGRHYLEDGLGVRWVDLHPGSRQQLTLAFPKQGWGGDGFFLRSLAHSLEYRLSRGDDVALTDRRPQPLSIAQRGAIHEAFTQLFTHPFDLASISAADTGSQGEPTADVEVEAISPEPGRNGTRVLLLAEAGVAGAVSRRIPALLAGRLQLRSTSRNPVALSFDVASGAGGQARETYVGVTAGVAWGLGSARWRLFAGIEAGPGVVSQSAADAQLWSPLFSTAPVAGATVWMTRRIAASFEARLAATLLRVDGSTELLFRPIAGAGIGYAL